MTIDRIYQRDVDTASKHETVPTVAQRMESRNVGSLVVLDEGGYPVGIVTDRDLALRVLAHRLDPEETAVADVMTRDPHALAEDTTIEEAVRAMRSHGVRRMPVVADDGRLRGVVSLDDVLTRLADALGHVRALIAETSPASLAGA